MSDALRDLYQEVIMDHNRNPRNFRALPEPDRTAHGQNPLCGDEVTVYLKLDGDTIQEATFEGHGCAISKSSASLMTTNLKGRSTAEAKELFRAFHALVTKPDGGDPEVLGKLKVFAGVHEFPARVKCAALAWRTLEAALDGEDRPVSTE